MQVAYYQQRYGQGGQQEELPTSVLGKQEELPNSAPGNQEELPDSASYTATYISGKQEELPSGKQRMSITMQYMHSFHAVEFITC